jgi:hypothetical protein
MRSGTGESCQPTAKLWKSPGPVEGLAAQLAIARRTQAGAFGHGTSPRSQIGASRQLCGGIVLLRRTNLSDPQLNMEVQMKNRDIKQSITQLMTSGVMKPDIYSMLVGQGAREKAVARHLAAYRDTHLRDENRTMLRVLIVVMLIQAVIAYLLGSALSTGGGHGPGWLWGGLFAAIPLLFALGFYRQVLFAFNAYIALTLIQLPKLLTGITETPTESLFAVAINLAILAFVWFVRSRLFPDIGIFGPRKADGNYVFTT